MGYTLPLLFMLTLWNIVSTASACTSRHHLQYSTTIYRINTTSTYIAMTSTVRTYIHCGTGFVVPTLHNDII